MSQLGFSGELAPVIKPIYLLDTSPVIRLDGKDRPPFNPPEFTVQERALIWNGLEALAEEGRLKIIQPVRAELERLHPEGLRRLAVYKGHRYSFRKTPNTWQEYQRILVKFPHIRPKPGRDPADPWLILVCRRTRYPIITQEESLTQRRSAKRDLRIPDICSEDDLPPALDLRTLANHEGWLP